MTAISGAVVSVHLLNSVVFRWTAFRLSRFSFEHIKFRNEKTGNTHLAEKKSRSMFSQKK